MTEPTRRGPGAVTVLASVLAVLLLIWIVGAFLLIRFADDLPEIPTSPSPTGEDRIAQDRIAQDRIAQDRIAQDRIV